MRLYEGVMLTAPSVYHCTAQSLPDFLSLSPSAVKIYMLQKNKSAKVSQLTYFSLKHPLS